ncbi:MAG: PIG-L family deacetylase [Firmicutes bacterium]|nr:PIG-L family deacetylase [Bacillota bacterium]
MNYDLFKNKKVLLFVPHQDDEINIAYGLLYKIRNIAESIKVVYSTNGNYVVNEKYRLKEGVESLKNVGITKENIIFMGYSDQIPESTSHLYHEKKCWIDNKNNFLTKAIYNDDYHYLKYNEHAIFNKHNFLDDIKSIILDEMPDIIICIDFDSHPDHRALSLSFEKALGIILKENNKYHPKVLKAFAYPTSYKGYDDYNYNNPSTKFLREENGLKTLQNPYYDWDKRIIFKSPSKATNYLYLNNIYFYGLLKHKSQYILNRINQVVNNDLVFFERETNNLLNKAKISVSSGNPDYLNDFMLFDTDNITGGINREVALNEGYTLIDKNDKNKKVTIEFLDEVNINVIKIYVKNAIKKIVLKTLDETLNARIKYENNIYIASNLNLEKIKKIEIIFDDKKDIEISEIEVLENIDCIKYAYLGIDGNVYNDYYTNGIPKINLITNVDEDFIINMNKKSVELIYDNKIIDIIHLHKKIKFILNVKMIINKITLLIGRIYQKMVKEIRKIGGK